MMNLQILRGVSRKTFFVFLTGNTMGAHRDFVKKLEDIGHTETNFYEECDYLVVFCPIASRVGTDISEALSKIPGNKRTILVVMHHTFDSKFIVAKSRRLVNHPDVELTVDCLFYENRFLDCNQNYEAWLEVQTYLGVSFVQIIWTFIRRNKWLILLGCGITLVTYWKYWTSSQGKMKEGN